MTLHIQGPTGFSLCGGAGRQTIPASATCSLCLAAQERKKSDAQRAPAPTTVITHVMARIGFGEALCGGDARAWADPEHATCTACKLIHGGAHAERPAAPARLEDLELRRQIIALAKKAFAHGVNPWADSYRENWPEIMAREAPCEAMVLALRPDVVLRLLGVDPYA